MIDDPKTIQISLPLLVRDWLRKKRYTKECVSIREYYDVVFGMDMNPYEQTLSHLDIICNATLQQDSSTVYQIKVEQSTVYIFCRISLRSIMGSTTSNIIANQLDYRNPSFFKQLAKAIGCKCKKHAKKPSKRPSLKS